MRTRTKAIGSFFTALIVCLPFTPDRISAQDATPVPPTTAAPNSVAGPPDQASRPCTVAGTVTSLATGEPLKKVEVVLSPVSPPANGHHKPETGTTDANGRFSLEHVSPGRYLMSVTRDGYLSQEYGQKDGEATSNGVDLLAQGVIISSGSAPSSIDLVYSSNTGRVLGTVTGADDLPVPGAYVVLVKDTGPHEQDDQLESAATDQYGKFEISGVPPGRYKAVALQKFDPETANDTDYLKPFAAKADSFDASSGSEATLQLKTVPATTGDAAN